MDIEAFKAQGESIGLTGEALTKYLIQRIEKYEKAEREERLERERNEREERRAKEQAEREERLAKEQAEREERLEKEKIQREKEQAEREERLEKEKIQAEREERPQGTTNRPTPPSTYSPRTPPVNNRNRSSTNSPPVHRRPWREQKRTVSPNQSKPDEQKRTASPNQSKPDSVIPTKGRNRVVPLVKVPIIEETSRGECISLADILSPEMTPQSQIQIPVVQSESYLLPQTPSFCNLALIPSSTADDKVSLPTLSMDTVEDLTSIKIDETLPLQRKTQLIGLFQRFQQVLTSEPGHFDGLVEHFIELTADIIVRKQLKGQTIEKLYHERKWIN
ncbi:hypothetical protein C0Q70_18450 [Pomacea canaliculata]|uniref:Uncharacterized protein n=1 Tax=Pomacea canaliculata TaxID=400727 RepID=A0A2T7NN77_POMCA|nr:hypothetical protein C0Q70_18450 [Pomacea canaliculata]